jgi:hypothetical protein
MKGSIPLTAVWSFVVIAAGYDSYFAWREQAAIEAWEMNPVALWAARTLGVQTLIGFKAAGIAFGIGLAVFCHQRYHRLGRRFTIIIGSAYLLLSAYYIVCHVGGASQGQFLWRESARASTVTRAQPYPSVLVLGRSAMERSKTPKPRWPGDYVLPKRTIAIGR